jgi:hypothetical protein
MLARAGDSSGVSSVEIRASMRQEDDGRWTAAVVGEGELRVSAPTREECLGKLREAVSAGPGDLLVVEVVPRLAGVAEAAAVMRWDKRRVVTYIDRGRFPQPLQSLASGRVWLREELERFSAEWHARRAERLARAASAHHGGPESGTPRTS